MELVIASNNRHKLDEIQALAGKEFELKTLNDIGCDDEIPETGNTFADNAGQKSRYIFNRYQLNCFGDDSGLEVDALDGEPGVYSARYSGSRDPEANLQLVLHRLGNNTNRTARFKTVISLIFDGKEYLFKGTVEGEITHARSGIEGFGYDPIFKPDGYDITFAEMSMEEKNKISHRAKAIHEMISFLRSQI